ncbi:MAG: hypothetical protein HYR75_04615, partial [Gemmatimonadetes bacterium]|nr:hypothetical protein [Gemmatimonadota bacterium]
MRRRLRSLLLLSFAAASPHDARLAAQPAPATSATPLTPFDERKARALLATML